MSNFLPTPYQQYIHTSRYARYVDALGRRETWPETVARYFDFMTDHLRTSLGYELTPELRGELEEAVLTLQVLPSMRALMTAGPALARDHVAAYNCAYLPVDSVAAFHECLKILLCGTGVGFGVKRSDVAKLPLVAERFAPTDTLIVVEDSKEGWVESFKELLALLWAGRVPAWDTSRVRPAGARLKTFGGRASGPEPLEDLFRFAVKLLRNAAGRQLTSLECHDLMCKIADVVVVGGVRRSALISLSDLDDTVMRDAKAGAWWEDNPQRALANNSVAYDTRPSVGAFMAEWLALYNSKSGERGIFNREAAVRAAARSGRRVIGYTEAGVPVTELAQDGVTYIEFGCNPCSEINLRPYQFCNLTSVIVAPADTELSLMNKVRLATILGTFQATLTNFKGLRKVWTTNTEEERLLGVSLNGPMGHPLLNDPDDPELPARLEGFRDVAVTINRFWADVLGIPHAAAITCVKPEGTTSQLVNCASGMHDWHAPFYIRRVRGDLKDPVTQFMMASGIPWEPDVMKPNDMAVFSFPIKAPAGARTRHQSTALTQLKLWLIYQRHYCEHKPSITVSVRESEWMEVGAWVWQHFDELSGVSFLPLDDHTYQQAPYEDCTEAEYHALLAKMPVALDWSELALFEHEDATTGTQELACTAGGCEIR